MVRIDTNYIIRYFLNDDEAMANEAEKILMNEEVFIANEVVAEVIYVLEGVYGILRGEIGNLLLELIEWNNIFVCDKDILKNALKIYKEKNLDFVDCLLCAYSKKDKVLSFDKKLKRCIKSL